MTKTAEKRGFCTCVLDGRTDGPIDGPMDGQTDAFLTDATKKKDNIAWEFMSGIKQQQHIYFAVLVHDNACKFAAFVKNRHDLSPIMTHLASLDYRVDRHHFKVGSIFLQNHLSCLLSNMFFKDISTFTLVRTMLVKPAEKKTILTTANCLTVLTPRLWSK